MITLVFGYLLLTICKISSDQRSPPGLMRGAQAFATFTMEVFVKQQVIFKMLISLHFFRIAKYRSNAIFVSFKDLQYPAAQFIGYFV